jgi:hypothetical protein
MVLSPSKGWPCRELALILRPGARAGADSMGWAGQGQLSRPASEVAEGTSALTPCHREEID